MRRIKLDEWCARPPGERRSERKVRRRPTPLWKIRDSIIFIRTMDEYLAREEILVKMGERKWYLRV